MEELMHTLQMEIALTLTVGGVYSRRYDAWDDVEVDDVFVSRGGRQVDILAGVDRRAPAVQVLLANLESAFGDEILILLSADYFADHLP
jgi:hypothetical protein